MTYERGRVRYHTGNLDPIRRAEWLAVLNEAFRPWEEQVFIDPACCPRCGGPAGSRSGGVTRGAGMDVECRQAIVDDAWSAWRPANRGRHVKRVANVIEDALFVLETQGPVSLEVLAGRCGYDKPTSLERALLRARAAGNKDAEHVLDRVKLAAYA